MEINKKLLTVLLLVVMIFALNSVSAMDNSTNQESINENIDTSSSLNTTTASTPITDQVKTESVSQVTLDSSSNINHNLNSNSQENTKDTVSNNKNYNGNTAVVKDNSNYELSGYSSNINKYTTDKTTATVKDNSNNYSESTTSDVKSASKVVQSSDNVENAVNVLNSTSAESSYNASYEYTITLNSNSSVIDASTISNNVISTYLVKNSVKTLKTSDNTAVYVTISNYADLKTYAEKTDANYIITMRPGTYTPTSIINIGNNVTIIGDGSVVIGSSSSNNILSNIQVLFNVGTNTVNITGINFTNIKVEKNDNNNNLYVISTQPNSNLYITNCLFENITLAKTADIDVIINSNSIKTNITNTTFKNIITRNGVIASNTDLTVNNSSFINNKGDLYSAAIWIMYGNANINNSLFKGNYLDNGDVTGSVIYNANGNVTLTDSLLDSNYKIGTYGGVIYNNYNFTIINTIINNNKATQYGGAIYQQFGNLTLKDVTLSNNSVSQLGGSIYNAQGNVIITDSNIYNSKAVSGGAIFNSAGKINITNSKFNNNTASFNGGVIFNSGKINITSVTFYNSTAKNGGVIYNTEKSILNITDSLFYNSTTSQDGGVIYNKGNANITNVEIKNSTSTKQNGGVIVTYNGIINMNNVAIDNSTVLGSIGGGVIYSNNTAITINNTKITNSIVNSNDGGVVWIQYGSLTIANTTITNSSSAGSYGGGVIYALNTVISLDNINVSNSTADYYNRVASGGYDGGVIYISNSKLSIKNSNFENSIAGDGGFLYALDTPVTLDNITVSNTTANKFDGGAIYIKGSSLNIKDSSFNNSIARYGGAIYALDTIVTLDNITVSNSTTNKFDGGAIYIESKSSSSSLTIKDSSFNNSIARYGGAIYASNTPVTLDNITVSNTATNKFDGGAIYMDGNTLTVTNSNFNNSTARYGGVIYGTKSDITVDNVNFTNTSAIGDNGFNSDGGTIYVDKGTLNIKNSNISNSKAMDEGGAIFADKSILTVDNVDFNNCTTQGTKWNTAGGAIYTSDGTMSVTHSRISNSSSLWMGGAIYNKNADSVTIAYNNFTNIYADTETLASPNAKSRDIHDNTFYNCSMAKDNLAIVAQDYALLNEVVNVNITFGLKYPEYYDPDISEKTDLYSDCKFDVYYTTVNNKYNPVFSYTTDVGVHNYTVPASYVGYIDTYIKFNSINIVSNTETILVQKATTITIDQIADNYTLTNIPVTAHVKDKDGKDILSGSVTFTNGDGYSITVPVINGVATTTINYTIKGEYTVTATYNDTTGTYQNNTNTTTVKITPIPTTTTITKPVTMKVNETTTITVVVTDKNGYLVKSGTVTFTNDNIENKIVNVNNGIATYDVNYTNNGTYTITATYNGDDTYKASNNQTTVKTTKYDTEIITSKITGNTTTPVTVNVTIKDERDNPVTTGNATFIDENGKEIGKVIVSTDGTAKITYTNSISGNYTLKVNYTDSTGKYNNSTNDIKVEIVPTETNILTTDKEITVGTPVTVNVTITDKMGNPVTTGNVTFKFADNTIDKIQVKSDGTAEVTYTPATSGDQKITVIYTDDTGKYANNTNTVNIIVNAIKTITTTVNVIGTVGDTLIIEANVTDINSIPIKTGTLKFVDENGTVISSVDITGSTVNVQYTKFVGGTYPVTITYTDKNGIYASSSAISNVTFNKINTNIITTDITGTVGTATDVTVKITDKSTGNIITTGTVTFTDENGREIGTADVADGTAIIQYTADTKGDKVITVTYTDSTGKYNDSTGSINAKIQSIPTTTITYQRIDIKTGDLIYLNTTVIDNQGNPVTTGTVTFTYQQGLVTKDVSITQYSNGQAKTDEFNYSDTTIDYATISYTDPSGKYSDSSNFTIVYVTLTGGEYVNATVIHTNPTYGNTISDTTLKVTVTDGFGKNVITGKVTFINNDTEEVLGSVDVDKDGTATLSYLFDTKANYNITTKYTDISENYPDSTNKFVATINAVDTNIVISQVSGKVNQDLKVTATVTDEYNHIIPNGEVIFTDNDGNEIGRNITDANGVATITVNYGIQGIYDINASYAGNDTYNSNKNSSKAFVSLLDTNIVVTPISGTTLTNITIKSTVTDENGNIINTGKVTYDYGNGTTEEVSIIDGVATTIVNYKTQDNYKITATYNGNDIYNSVTNTSVAAITPISTTTTLSPISGTTKSDITVTATIIDANNDNVQSGFATFTDNHGLIKTVEVKDGIATITVNYDSIGDYTMSVAYLGDNTYDPSNYDLSKIDLVEGVVPIDDHHHDNEDDSTADNTITDTTSTDTTITDNIVSDDTSTTETTTTITDTPTEDTTTTTTITDNTNNNNNNQNTITENPIEDTTTTTTITEDTTTTTPIDNTIIDDTPTTDNNIVIDNTPTTDTPTDNNSVIDNTPTTDTPVTDNTSTDIIDVDTPTNDNTIDTENTTTPTDTPTDTNTTETTNTTVVTPDVITPTTDVTENTTVTTPTTTAIPTATTPTTVTTATTPATATATATPTATTATATATATTPATATATATTPATATATNDGASADSNNNAASNNTEQITNDSRNLTSYNSIIRRIKLRSFFSE